MRLEQLLMPQRVRARFVSTGERKKKWPALPAVAQTQFVFQVFTCDLVGRTCSKTLANLCVCKSRYRFEKIQAN